MNRLSFLKSLLSLGAGTLLPINIVSHYKKFYLLQCFVAGFRFYKGMELLPEMNEGDMLNLVREPDNEYDKSAIALHWNGEKVGFIPKAENAFLSKLLDAEALELTAEIVHLNKEVKPWENLNIGVYFLKTWVGELPADKQYLNELSSPRYRTLKGKGELITKIDRPDTGIPSETDWVSFFTRSAENDSILEIIKRSNLDHNFQYGAQTGDYLVVNKNKLDIDTFSDMASQYVDQVYYQITEYADELEGLFGENGYVVLSTQEAEDMIQYVENLEEVSDKLGNRYIEMILA